MLYETVNFKYSMGIRICFCVHVETSCNPPEDMLY